MFINNIYNNGSSTTHFSGKHNLKVNIQLDKGDLEYVHFRP